MTATTTASDVDRFRLAIASRLGLNLDVRKADGLRALLGRRVKANGLDAASYLSWLEVRAGDEELGVIAEELTVPETYFFRNMPQYRAFIDRVLPDRLGRAGGRPLSLLSLGCASGEEAYSLAIAAREAGADLSSTTSIVGVDMNDAALAKARAARYSAWALRETSPDRRERWFRASGPREFALDDGIRAAVRFERRNLVDDDPEFWRPGAFDVVFCRNVLMYFTPAQAQRVVSHIARSLAPGGFLFLGHAETLRALSDAFDVRQADGAFFHQLKDAGRTTAQSRSPRATAPAVAGSSFAPASFAVAPEWVDAIRRASERIAVLADHGAIRGHRGASVKAAAPGFDRFALLALVREERFADALERIGALPTEAGHDPDVQLLRAILLTHLGDLTGAADVCQHLLESNDSNAGAHYLLALGRDHVGDRIGAVHHDGMAVCLDPGFAMPRLHLGMLARRSGQVAVARDQLGQAIDLLRREDNSRLLLFGGGFTREALIELCRAELVRCGGVQ